MASVSHGAGSPLATSEAPNPRKRGRTACTRCKNRKQKCDDQLPICSNCRKSGASCDKADVSEETPPIAYTRALEDRVAFLETRLGQLQQSPNAEVREEPGAPPAPAEQGHGRTGGSGNNALSDIVALISLGNPEEPAYVGPSSGMSLAMVLNDMVQATVWSKSLPDLAPNYAADGREVAGEDRENARRMAIAELIANSIKEPPSDELGSRMIKAYLHQLHPRYPFLDPEEIWELHRERMSLAAASPKTMSREQRFGIFKLYLLYATGATLLQLTEKRTSIGPEGFYLAALQHISAARESRTIQNIEAMTLLVVYHLRSASSHGMWYMIGLAMRTCIDLGMHRKGYEVNLSQDVIHRRRRLFWTVYSLERTISISLGRPVSVSDRQIDVPYPRTDISPQTPSTCSPTSLPQPSGGSLTMALHLFRLRRIESIIHHSIYRADKPLHALLPKVDPLYQSLTSWRSSLLASFPTTAPVLHYPLLLYHRAVRLLIQPFLPLLSPADSYHSLCLRAAGDVCQAHKRLHQSLDYGHSFIAVQTVFVAGMTLLYGLSRWTNEVWSAKLADDIRACSLVLFVMGERAQWVRRYRDAFEVLVNAAMGKLHGSSDPVNDASPAPYDRHALRPGESRHDSSRTSSNQDHHPVRAQHSTHTEHISAPEPFQDSWNEAGIAATGEANEAWPIVMELSNWIEQDEGSPLWMPEFEMLQNLSGVDAKGLDGYGI